MATGGEYILIVVLSLLMIADLIGNTLVCIVVLRNRALKTPMNVILVNLAIADMMVALFMAPRHIFLRAFSHPSGEAGDYVCKFITGGNIMWVGGAASSFCLVAVAVERYYVIVYPHLEKGRITRKKLKAIIVACWSYAVIIDIPPFLVINYNEKRDFCTEFWPNENLAKAYTVLMFNLDFALPVVLMGALYSKVVHNLWFRRQSTTEVAQLAVLRSRKKVTKMVLIVTVIFGVSWMPVLTLYMLSYYLPSQFEYASIVHNAAVVLICVNSSINPFIYSFQMRGFKTEIKKFFAAFCNSRVEVIQGSQNFGTTSTLNDPRSLPLGTGSHAMLTLPPSMTQDHSLSAQAHTQC